MSDGWTNTGKLGVLEAAFNGDAHDFYVALVTNGAPPTTDTETMAELVEIEAGNGYTSGGVFLYANSTDFDFAGKDDGDNNASVQIRDIQWTASGGSIPPSGSGAAYAVLTDDNGTVSSRKVYAWWDLLSERVVQDTKTLTLFDLELRAT